LLNCDDAARNWQTNAKTLPKGAGKEYRRSSNDPDTRRRRNERIDEEFIVNRFQFQEKFMMSRKTIQVLSIGFTLCFYLLFGIGQSQSLAATLPDAKAMSQAMSQTPSELLNFKSGVDRFLTSIPAGYYTIATVEGLKSLLENPQTTLVDVREPSEYRSGHIPNAINIPLRTLTHDLGKIARDRPVVLYCSTGYRSAMGVMTLHLLGYDNIQGFPPSFAGWKTAGEAIAKA
jgi:rhodanese-related sulfurtransferase